MKKIIMQRGYGKTYQLIKESALTGNYIVCHSHQEANRIQHEAMDLGLKIPLPITYGELIEGKYYTKGINGFLVDNVEYLLQYISPRVPINAITMTPHMEIIEITKDKQSRKPLNPELL